jgi:hypothetical protein
MGRRGFWTVAGDGREPKEKAEARWDFRFGDWDVREQNPRSVRSIAGQVDCLCWGCAQAEAPSDLVALGGGAKLADFAVGRCFESAAAAHFLKDSFGIEFCFEALEGAVNGLSFF